MIEQLKGVKILQNQSLKEYTTLHIGGHCRYLFLPKSEEEILSILKVTNPIILGRGSNVLINDEKEYESVMVLNEFNQIERMGDTLVCEAGARLMDVCLFAAQNELTGLEFAYGIPGSVGGAIMMNAGAYGGEIRDIVKSVKGSERTYSKEECDFGYRHSIFTDSKECILKVVFQLRKGQSDQILLKMKELIKKRMEKQPLDKYSAGSTFKRGKDFYASLLISECGLKGMSVRDAKVSTKHAGFLINEKNATYHDFKELIEKVQHIVYEKTGKQLECEIKVIGE